jgi:dipeptidyl aminopeptidase/acylaminoacyl peptidase
MGNSHTSIKTAPYGSWSSPIDPKLLTSSSPSYAYPYRDGENLYWLESRPWENGRSVVVQRNVKGETTDVLPAPLSARSKVHEYGGTPYIVIYDVLYFCLYDDQRIYRLNLKDKKAVPEPITAENKYRYADFCYDKHRNQLICVAENHDNNLKDNPQNSIVAIPLDGSMSLTTLCCGDDFYAYPRLDNTGTQLCWISWNHPNMPWDNTTLWLTELDTNGIPIQPILVAGNSSAGDRQASNINEAIFQPQWSPDNQLYFVSDRDNWWNIYCWQPDVGVENILPLDAEFATPLWVLGMSSYGFCTDSKSKSTLVCCYSQNGAWKLGLKAQNAPMTTIESNYTQFSDIYCDSNKVWLVGAAAKISAELIELDISSGQLLSVAKGAPLPFDQQYLSMPNPVSFETMPLKAILLKSGVLPDNKTPDVPPIAHGFYYQPCNPDYQGIENTQPPLIVICHGGPTGSTSTALNLKIQYWTSRGFAVLDINYRGSTGYGRDYRQQLHSHWGITDVADVVAGARYLTDQQLVDPNKIAIRGSSAGGYTVLAALCFYDVFKAGACLYGIGDLETLAQDTHKFESRYLDKLIGPYPEKREIYQQRSPINHVNKFDCPVIFFQGLDDKVVPPEQAIMMTQALRDKNLPVAYLPFQGEGHGFRKAGTIKQSLEAELYFYSKIFGFTPEEILPEIHIDNLPGSC